MDETTPLVSVLIPAYNAGRFIQETIQSVLNQSLPAFELIILNDCSTDNTVQVVESFDDDRIKLYHNEINCGIAYTRNRLVQLAQTNYLAILDADDISRPQRLEKQYKFLRENPNYAFIGASRYLIDTEGERIGERFYKYPSEVYPPLLFYHNNITQSSVMINRRYLEGIEGPYDTKLPPAEDYDLWIKLSTVGKIGNLPDKLIFYRIHQSSISNSRDDLMNLSVNKIVISNLMRMGLSNHSERQFLIHKSFQYHELLTEAEITYEEYKDWFTILVKSNSRQKLYDQNTFVLVTFYKWQELLPRFYQRFRFSHGVDLLTILRNEILRMPRIYFKVLLKSIIHYRFPVTDWELSK